MSTVKLQILKKREFIVFDTYKYVDIHSHNETWADEIGLPYFPRPQGTLIPLVNPDTPKYLRASLTLTMPTWSNIWQYGDAYFDPKAKLFYMDEERNGGFMRVQPYHPDGSADSSWWHRNYDEEMNESKADILDWINLGVISRPPRKSPYNAISVPAAYNILTANRHENRDILKVLKPRATGSKQWWDTDHWDNELL